MKYSVKAFYNTGFDVENIPDMPSLLDGCTSRTFSDVYHWQSSELSYVDISCSYEDISDVDYIKIGASYYFVTSIEMQSETRCARLFLTLDALTTIGGASGVSYDDGWLERAHASDDSMFSNTMPESFTPQEILVVEEGEEIGTDTTGSNTKIITSTVDLSDLGSSAWSYSVGDYSVTVPIPNQASADTSFEMPDMLNYGISTVSSTINNTTSYIVNDSTRSKLAESIGQLQGIGALESSIGYSYCIPSDYCTYSADSNGQASRVAGIIKTYETTLKFKYMDGIQNNKVFSLFNTYNVCSISSGNSGEYEASMIHNDSEESPSFRFFVDPSPTGRTFCRPYYYNKNAKNLMLGSIAGGDWVNSPISASGSSGYNKTLFNDKIYALSQIGGANSDFLKTTVLGRLIDRIAYGSSASEALQKGAGNVLAKVPTSENISANAVAPNMVFPASVSNQTYLGNGFYITRTRLSENDAKRFDRYLTMYGYACYKPLESSDINNRTYFNYIKASNVSIKTNAGKRIREQAEAQLIGGVRIWHVLPDSSYYSNNPIK